MKTCSGLCACSSAGLSTCLSIKKNGFVCMQQGGNCLLTSKPKLLTTGLVRLQQAGNTVFWLQNQID